MQPAIIRKRKVDWRGFVLGPRLCGEHLSHRVSRAQFHGDKIPNEPVDEQLMQEVLAILKPIHNWIYAEGRPENNDPGAAA